MEPQLRKNKIQQSAIQVFGSKGYHHATIADIIADADIARGTFYLYYDSKQAVFTHILDDLFFELEQAIERVDVTLGPLHAVSVITENMQRVFQIVLENPLRGKILMHSAVSVDNDIDQKLSVFYGKVVELIRHSLRQGIENAIIRSINVDTVSLSILGSCKEILHQLATESPHRPNEVGHKDIIRELVSYNLRALCTDSFLAFL